MQRAAQTIEEEFALSTGSLDICNKDFQLFRPGQTHELQKAPQRFARLIKKWNVHHEPFVHTRNKGKSKQSSSALTTGKPQRPEENFWGPQMALLGPMKTNGTSGAHEVLYNRILVPSLFYVYYHSKRATLKHANDSRSRSVQCKTLDSLVMQQLSYHLTHPEYQNFDQLKIKQYW